MDKTEQRTKDEMLPEYDFRTGVRSKYASRFASASMENVMFEEGRCYTRDDIHKKLGGSTVWFLPTVNGKVVCGCFCCKINPEAPEVVHVGASKIRESTAEQLYRQREEKPVPVFLRNAGNGCVGNKLEYAGTYRAVGLTRDRKVIEEYKPGAGEETAIVLTLTRDPA